MTYCILSLRSGNILAAYRTREAAEAQLAKYRAAGAVLELELVVFDADGNVQDERLRGAAGRQP